MKGRSACQVPIEPSWKKGLRRSMAVSEWKGFQAVGAGALTPEWVLT